jgi:hypothetical protein
MQLDEPADPAALQAVASVEALLDLLQLPLCAPWFRAQDVDLGVFLTLLEPDLEEVQVGGSASMISLFIAFQVKLAQHHVEASSAKYIRTRPSASANRSVCDTLCGLCRLSSQL